MSSEAEQPKRRRGAPEGERNGNYKHGRYSRLRRDQRAQGALRAYREWRKRLPPPDRPWLKDAGDA